MKEVKWSDQEFGNWLYNIDPAWGYERVGNSNHFTANGRVVAVAIYDNEKCTRKLFIRERTKNNG
jgi:phosphomevalonate kinase